ncbi:MAG: TetR/AcrR family transcriptional regulator [Holophagaceae bacterium]|nr:TetR/AcrR family transcriptional regulator [Holophagaceae bacterium]
MTTRSSDTRNLLLHSALAILMEGRDLLTLDAVVKRSGVSKGGLTHHFPTKEALIEGVIEEMISQFMDVANRLGDSAAPGTAAGVKAYMDASLDPALRRASADLAKGVIRLYGSDLRENSPFLDPWRKLFASRLDRFRQAGDAEGFAKAAIITLVIESFVMIDVFNLYRFSAQEMDAIKREMLNITK